MPSAFAATEESLPSCSMAFSSRAGPSFLIGGYELRLAHHVGTNQDVAEVHRAELGSSLDCLRAIAFRMARWGDVS